jgi:hypothetical protein
LQIRQVAHLMEHYMQPARIKLHAKEHTNNPVQRPNFRGHAAGDGEVTRACVGKDALQTIIPAVPVLSPAREDS